MRKNKKSLIIFFALLSGCSTIYTTNKTPDTQGQDRQYYLPKGLISFNIERKEKGKDVTVAITSKIIADTESKYYLKRDHNAFYDDFFIVQTENNGLLKAINTTSDFKGPDIVEKLGQMAGYMAALASAEATCDSDKAQEPFSVNMDVDPYVGTNPLNKTLAKYCLLADISNVPTKITSSFAQHDGVAYRGMTAIQISLESTDNKNIKQIFVASIPDESIINFANVDRGVFVKRKINYTFDNGMLTNSDSDYPSEVVGFISLPLAILKGVSEATIGQFGAKTQTISNEAAYLNAQKTLLEAQKELAAAEK